MHAPHSQKPSPTQPKPQVCNVQHGGAIDQPHPGMPARRPSRQWHSYLERRVYSWPAPSTALVCGGRGVKELVDGSVEVSAVRFLVMAWLGRVRHSHGHGYGQHSRQRTQTISTSTTHPDCQYSLLFLHWPP